MIRDLEELVNSIKNADIKEYMKEALDCYNAKSYRACVVLSVVAGMYDLHYKLKALANSISEIQALDEEIDSKKFFYD